MTERQKDEYMSIKVTSVKIEPFNAKKIKPSHQTPTKSPQQQKEDPIINHDDNNDNNDDNNNDDNNDDNNNDNNNDENNNDNNNDENNNDNNDENNNDNNDENNNDNNNDDYNNDDNNEDNENEINENDIDENDIDDTYLDENMGVNQPEIELDNDDQSGTSNDGVVYDEKTCGVIYLAYGKKYIQEAIKSARSFKKFHAKIPVSVYTDHVSTALRYPTIFNRIVKVDPVKQGFKVAAYAKLEKIKAIRDSPYEVTLYLDCDTVVLQPIGELFKKVSGYDMLIANSPHLDTSTKPYKLVALAKPNAYNSGVIVYQKNERTRQLFKDWLSLSSVDKNRLMKVRENFYDQPKLVKLLNSKNSQIKLKVIPNVIYNARHTMILRLKKQHLYSKVKIIHTHTPNK